jgi:hypothetical protein
MLHGYNLIRGCKASTPPQTNGSQPSLSSLEWGTHPACMIDDILMRPPTGVGSTAAVHAADVQKVHGYNTDHALLTAALSGAQLNVIHVTDDPVCTRTTPTKRLQTPVKATARQAFQQRLLENASALIQQLNGRLSPALQEATAFLEEQQCKNAKKIHKLTTLGDRPAGEVVDEL